MSMMAIRGIYEDTMGSAEPWHGFQHAAIE